EVFTSTKGGGGSLRWCSSPKLRMHLKGSTLKRIPQFHMGQAGIAAESCQLLVIINDQRSDTAGPTRAVPGNGRIVRPHGRSNGATRPIATSRSPDRSSPSGFSGQGSACTAQDEF